MPAVAAKNLPKKESGAGGGGWVRGRAWAWVGGQRLWACPRPEAQSLGRDPPRRRTPAPWRLPPPALQIPCSLAKLGQAAPGGGQGVQRPHRAARVADGLAHEKQVWRRRGTGGGAAGLEPGVL